MEKQKKVSPKREKMLRIIAKAAQFQSLVGGAFYQSKAERIAQQADVYDDTDSLQPKGGCKSAGRCAMAELFFSAGYSNKKLSNMSGMPHGWNQKDFQTLWDNYRIDSGDADDIISANDDNTGCSLEEFKTREGKVAKVISGLKDRVRTNPHRYMLTAGEAKYILPTEKENKVLRSLGLAQVYQDLADGNSAYYLGEQGS